MIFFSLAGYLIASHVTIDRTEAQCAALKKSSDSLSLEIKKDIDALKIAVEKDRKEIAFRESVLETRITLNNLNAIELGECLAKKKS